MPIIVALLIRSIYLRKNNEYVVKSLIKQRICSKINIYKRVGGNKLQIHDYITQGGKNAIKEYLSSLPEGERGEGYRIRHKIIEKGVIALEALNTRQLKGKLWEIKFSQNRIMYVLADSENIYFLHACKKQKGKAEKFELEKAIQRAKEAGFTV